MKKLSFMVIVILFISCGIIEEQEPGTATVINKSSNFPVTYFFGYPPTELKTIEAKDNESDPDIEDSFERPKYAYIKSYEPSKRVILTVEYPNKNDGEYTFKDRDSFLVKVINKTGLAAELTADGWMDDMTLTNATTEQPTSDWLIYTDKPKFSASANGFPADVVHSFDEGIFKVTVR